MSGFKNLLKSDTSTDSKSAALGGQGSHFQSQRDDDPPFATRAAEGDTLGSTATGTEPYTASDSAAQPPARSGSITHSFPKTLRSGNDTSSTPSAGAYAGNAAVGETTTYSSRPLASGDPTGSVIDHQSTDPLTYKLPEAGSHPPAVTGTGNSAATGTSPTSATRSTRATSSAAASAAAAAWAAHNKQDMMPGEFPSDGSENPYRATNLDPRVDGGKPHHSSSLASSSMPSRTRDSDLGTSTSAGAGNFGTSQGERNAPTTTHEHTGPAPSTLTTTADPAARAAQYAASSDTKVPDTTPSTTTQSQPAGEQQGVMGRALGAIGLGGAAGYLGYGAKGSDTTEPRDTSAVSTQPGVAAQESGPPKHYRRESIPTTAYPSTDAARPIAPPVGGTVNTRPSVDRQESSPPKHYRRESIPTTAYPSTDAARPIAAPVGGTANTRRGVDQSYSGSNTDSRTSNDRGIGGTPATVEGVTSGSGFGLGSATSGVSRQEYSESSQVRDNIGTGSSHDSHTGRGLAAGGAAAAATGAGIHGLQHQGRDDNLRSSAAEDARREPSSSTRDDTRSSGHSYTIGGHQTHQSASVHGGPAPVDAISSRDPNYRDPTTSQGTGFGSSTSPSAPIAAVAAAPGRYEGQDYSSSSRTTPSNTLGSGEHSLRRDDNSHTGRGAALGASAAAAAIYASSSGGDRHGTIHDAITVGTPTTTSTSGRGTSTGYGTTDSRQYETHDTHDTSSYGTSTGYAGTGTRGDTGSHGIHDTHGTSSYGTSTGYTGTGTRGVTDTHGTHGAHGMSDTTGLSSYGTSAGYGNTGPSSYGTSTGYGTTASTTGNRTLRQDDDHTGRNVGLGATGGAVAAGGAAYAAHDRHNERELEKQREADTKEAAKRERAQEKELEKERSHAEKEERKHQKEVEKEEKRQQKELDKEEREQAAAAEKREHARLAAEEEDRKRREREASAGVATVGTTGAVAHETQEKERKPSIFKRIFKRRKNKDTGEDEDYSSDDEEDKNRYSAGGVPVHLSHDKNRNVLGHEHRDKESYKDHPAWKGPVTDIAAENTMNTPGRPHPGAEERLGYEPGSTPAGYAPSGREGGAAAITGASAAGTSTGYGVSDQPRDSITGLQYDPSKDPNAAQRLTSHGTGPLDAGTIGLASSTDDRPRDSITGLPYDPSKDPVAAARLSEQAGPTGTGGVLGNDRLGEVGDSRR